MQKGNPQAMIQNLVKNNPKYSNAWEITQQILQSGGTKEEMLKKACQQSGADYNLIKEQVKEIEHGQWR